jgi:hypothetical protein
MLQWKGTRDGNVSSEPKQAQTPGSIVMGNMQTPTWIPHYSYLNQGFTPALMVKKKEVKSPPSLSSPSSASEQVRNDRRFFPSNENLHETGEHYDECDTSSFIIKIITYFLFIWSSELLSIS